MKYLKYLEKEFYLGFFDRDFTWMFKILDKFQYRFSIKFWWRTPNFLNKFKCESKMNIVEQWGVGVCYLAYNTLKVKGRAGTLG